MQSNGSYSALSPAVHGDIVLSINTIQHAEFTVEAVVTGSMLLKVT